MVRFGEAARRDIVERYNVKDKLGEYERLWKNLVENKKYSQIP